MMPCLVPTHTLPKDQNEKKQKNFTLKFEIPQETKQQSTFCLNPILDS